MTDTARCTRDRSGQQATSQRSFALGAIQVCRFTSIRRNPTENGKRAVSTRLPTSRSLTPGEGAAMKACRLVRKQTVVASSWHPQHTALQVSSAYNAQACTKLARYNTSWQSTGEIQSLTSANSLQCHGHQGQVLVPPCSE